MTQSYLQLVLALPFWAVDQCYPIFKSSRSNFEQKISKMDFQNRATLSFLFDKKFFKASFFRKPGRHKRRRKRRRHKRRRKRRQQRRHKRRHKRRCKRRRKRRLRGSRCL